MALTKNITAKQRLAQGTGIAIIGATLLSGCVAMGPNMLAAIDNETSTSLVGTCGSGGLVATGTYESLNEEQNKNAQLILGAVQERPGIDEKDRKQLAIITLITAIQESSLINVDYGDDIHGVRNPDGTLTSSIGLFQQQKWWGTVEQRMDPKTSTNLFIDALVKFDWKSMEYGAAAQKVQGSAHPSRYSPHVGLAEEIIANVGTDFSDDGSSEDKKDEQGDEETESSDDASPSTQNVSSGCKSGTGTGTAGEGDDYPLKANPAIVAMARHDPAAFDSTLDPWGLYVGQCVSYVAWRINVQMGWKEGQDYPFTMAKLKMAGQGNGYEWSAQLAEVGYKTDRTPKKGAIAWWDASANEYVGPMGHVAIVESYDLEAGTVNVSQYNAWPKPLEYSEQTFPIDKISGFIHVADLE